MKTQPEKWTALGNQSDRKVAHLAAIARVDTVYGGARALVIAKHCSKWDAREVVSHVYSRSTGRHCTTFEAWACPECGNVHLGQEAAFQCCAFDADEDFRFAQSQAADDYNP